MKTMNVKKACSIISRPGDDILDQCLQTGFQELYCRNVFTLKGHMLNLNKLVFLKIIGPLEPLTYKQILWNLWDVEYIVFPKFLGSQSFFLFFEMDVRGKGGGNVPITVSQN